MMQNKSANESFNQLVAKLFATNFVVIVSESAQHFSRHKLEDNFDNVLNQFSTIDKLSLTIRDLYQQRAYGLNGLRLRFADWTVLKGRPNTSQIKKLQFDLISSMSPQLHSLANQRPVEGSVMWSTPWFDKWKHLFIDTYELSDSDFIGTNFGCFFVITDQELENYKEVFAALITQIKKESWIRWIQPDFVRYYLVLSEQSLQTHISMDTPKASLYRELQSIYPNSYWLQIEATAPAADLKDEVFCDETTVRQDSTDQQSNQSSNHLAYMDLGGDPLSVSLDSKLNNDKRLSSGSDQSLKNSMQSLSVNDLSDRYIQSLKPKTALEGMASIFDIMFKEFISKTLVPWAEKQIKLLSDAISHRKGFRRSIFGATKTFFNNMNTSTVGLKGANTVVYLPEASEMQLRKLADISMSLRMYELAYDSYYGAKKDFQSEGAWLQYAAACEASAVASYYINKFQKRYFDDSITTYLDPNRVGTVAAMTAATRTTILATEAFRQLWPNESANLYIRMTGDDSDLRSALFLEQASKCFLEAGLRRRKSAFHYVLAGHRYNRCGLKHFALACYRQFSYSQWPAAADHVNLTVARLFLSIANSNQQLSTEYRAQGLELLRKNADKQLFFQEFIREIKKELEVNQSIDPQVVDNYYYLELPSVVRVMFDPIDGIANQKNKNLCFVGEELLLKLRLMTPFPLVLHQLKFFTDNQAVDCPAITSTLDSDEEIIIFLSVVPEIETDFTLLGLEYRCDDLVPIRCRFDDKQTAGLNFKTIRSLPAIAMDVRFHTPLNTGLASTAVQVLATEIIDLTLGLSVAHNGWKPSSVALTTNAILVNDSLEVLANEKEIKVNFESENRFKMQMPSQTGPHSVYFRLNYSENSTGRSRVLTKTIAFEVIECLSLEANIESVVSLRNSSSTDAVFVKSVDESVTEIPANLTTHLLSNGLTIGWTQPNGRYGVIRL